MTTPPLSVLRELPRLAEETYSRPWSIAVDDCRAWLTHMPEGYTVVALPGTHLTDPGDILADLELFARYQSPVGWAPYGCMKRAEGLWKLLQPVLNSPVILTGHSLGGAFAASLACLMDADGRKPDWLEMYEPPSCVSVDMAKRLGWLAGRWFWNYGDPIPDLPLGFWGTWAGRLIMLGEKTGTMSIERHYMAEVRGLVEKWLADEAAGE